ncbi:MAG: hypothetical protein A2Y80_01030 [Deltaproteobacteria bacterium RBG_13_58_19]|nr:MAG: hypothetical protein A2Y80_01030 [Deltaproteobacteria bacterium RBG_13_58_19]
MLVTSRNPHWQSLAQPVSVPVWPREEAVQFLLRRTGQTDAGAAQRLAESLGDLPLSLEQAGAYIAETGISLADYGELFQNRRDDLWGEEKAPLDYQHTVATTWSLTLDQVRQEAPEGADLLNLSSFLGPEDIPLFLLETEIDHIPESLKSIVTDPLARNRAVAALVRYSLVKKSGEGLTVHRLVQAVVRDRLVEEEREAWAAAAAKLVNSAFPFDSDDVCTWPVCARLLPHAQAAAGQAQALGAAPEAAARLWNQIGLYLWSRAEFKPAQRALEQALAMVEQAYGPNHPEVAIRVNNLGLALLGFGRPGGGEEEL